MPDTTPSAAAPSGSGRNCRICAPASTLIAVAPMNTQYGGVISAGRTGYWSSALDTMAAMSRYSMTPTAQHPTLSAARAPGTGRGRDVATAAID